MNKRLHFFTLVLSGVLLIVMLSSQKKVEQGKFYYAYKEKIYMQEVPGKHVLSFKDKEKKEKAVSLLALATGKEKIKNINENTVTLELLSGQLIEQVISIIKNEILLQKPVYKVDKQEMFYTDEIVIEVNKGVKLEAVLKIAGLAASVVKEEKQFFTILKVPAKFDASHIANTIQESGLVKYAHPNFIAEIHFNHVPNDTYFPNQFYLQNTGQVFNTLENHAGTPGADIKVTYAWDITRGSNSIVVAVLDGGISDDHPDLPNTRQVRLDGSNFVQKNYSNDPFPEIPHGDHCAGIIAATQDNNEGISGIAPNIRIMPIKISFGTANSNPSSSQTIANAIDFAWQNGADILSNSWGYETSTPNLYPIIVEAIQRAISYGRNGRGCVVVFSAGNTAAHYANLNGVVQFPSNVQIDGVLTVGG